VKGGFRKHYYWVIAAVALLQMLIYGGAVNNFSGYHMIPITQTLEISRTMFSLAESARSVVGVFSTMFSGLITRRFGYRNVTSAALLTASIAYVLFACLQSYWMLLIGCIMMGMAHGLCFSAGISRLVNDWFYKYRGTILGLVTAASGVGSSILGIVQSAAVERVSWRMSFAIVAGLQLALALILFVLVRNKPQDIGLRPYGVGQESSGNRPSVTWEGFSMETLQKQPCYYAMLVCVVLSSVCVLSTQYNIVPYFQDCGMSVTRTGKLYGVMMLALSAFKLMLGVLCDAIGAKRVLVISHLACAGGLSLILLLPQTDGAMITAMIVFDMAIPLTTMLFPLLGVELFGNRAHGIYVGTLVAMCTAGNIISGPVANLVYDLSGSYVPVFWSAAALSLVMLPVYGILFAMIKRTAGKLKAAGQL